MKKFLLVVLCLAAVPACKSQTDVHVISPDDSGQNGSGRLNDPFGSPGNGTGQTPQMNVPSAGSGSSSPATPANPVTPVETPVDPGQATTSPGSQPPSEPDIDALERERRVKGWQELRAMKCYANYSMDLWRWGAIDFAQNKLNDSVHVMSGALGPVHAGRGYDPFKDKETVLLLQGAIIGVDESLAINKTRFVLQVSVQDLGGVTQQRTIEFDTECRPVRGTLEGAPENSDALFAVAPVRIGTPFKVEVNSRICAPLETQLKAAQGSTVLLGRLLADTTRARQLSLCSPFFHPYPTLGMVMVPGGTPGGTP